MINFLLFSWNLISSFIFIQINHPLGIGLILLLQTSQICLLGNIFSFSYILFLTFLGGILLLSIYVTSLASNEIFSLSIILTIICTMFFGVEYVLPYGMGTNVSFLLL